MTISVETTGQACGAMVRGVDLTHPLTDETRARLRQLWLEHQVLGFPEQLISIDDLKRFALGVGPHGEDPFLASMPGHQHVVEVRREADETTPIFAESWHSDWSFLPSPPAGTALFGSVIPPTGGDTLFANQYAAWEGLPAARKRELEGLAGIHSARRGYAPTGLYGEADQGKGRSMRILSNESAKKTRSHPIARVHPETGRTALFISPGYTVGIEGMPQDEADGMLAELFAHQVRPEFLYRHSWSKNMLTLWDNRCVLHRATGGYQGHQRLLYRVTISERSAPLQ